MVTRVVLAEKEEAEVTDECSGPSLAEVVAPPCTRAGQAEGFTLGLKLAPGTLLPPPTGFSSGRGRRWETLEL